MNKLFKLVEQAKRSRCQTVAVANAVDPEVIVAVKTALSEKLCSFLLFGDKERILRLAKRHRLPLPNPDVEIRHTHVNAAEAAVLAVSRNEATILMKGNVSTKELLQAVLDKDSGLRTDQLLSHVALFDIPGREEPVFLTDAAINIAPTFHEKVAIILHAVRVARMLGKDCPKVAVIAPVDVINEAIPSTIDAAKLTAMQESGEISGCLIGGPISFDNAISRESAMHKGVHSKVSGVADILMVPTIEVGNALYKSFIYFARAQVAAIVCGARAPIVLPSRADSPESKLYSLALALLQADARGN